MIETMEMVTIDKLKFDLYLSSEEINGATQRVADQINQDYKGEEILLIGVLSGSVVFLSDLIRRLQVPVTIDFVKVSSYTGTASSGELELSLGFKKDIAGKNLILVEDIIDTGLTVSRLLKMAKCLRPKSIRLASLLAKPECIQSQIEIDYVGINIPDVFVVGYGMDYDQKGRELPEIYKLLSESQE